MSVKKLLKSYATLRREANPLELPTHNQWLTVKYYTVEQFSEWINTFGYKADPLGGLIDYTAHPDKFFDRTRKQGRDCDDFARMWSLWGIYNGYTAIEYIVMNPNSPFKTAHVVTILKWVDITVDITFVPNYIMCNYEASKPYMSRKKALNSLKAYVSYVDGLVWVKSDKFLPLQGE